MSIQSLEGLPPSFEVKIQQEPSAVLVKLSGEFDLGSKPKFESEIATLISDLKPASLVLDLSGVTFIDSSGLRTIVELYGQARDDSIDFAVMPGPREVQALFELTGLDRVLPMMDGSRDGRA
jgi:anti-sigma B factor antagonist